MLPSRYKSARILVRRLCRLPGETKAEFKRKIARLRQHFEQFNVDVSDLCQWFMSLRAKKESVGVPIFWDFFLTPLQEIEATDEVRDRWRSAVFDAVAGFRCVTELAGHPLKEGLPQAMTVVSSFPKSPTAVR